MATQPPKSPKKANAKNDEEEGAVGGACELPGGAPGDKPENRCGCYLRKQMEEEAKKVIVLDYKNTNFFLSFAGCGLMTVYEVGVAYALARHGKAFRKNVGRYTGSSTGFVPALLLALVELFENPGEEDEKEKEAEKSDAEIKEEKERAEKELKTVYDSEAEREKIRKAREIGKKLSVAENIEVNMMKGFILFRALQKLTESKVTGLGMIDPSYCFFRHLFNEFKYVDIIQDFNRETRLLKKFELLYIHRNFVDIPQPLKSVKDLKCTYERHHWFKFIDMYHFTKDIMDHTTGLKHQDKVASNSEFIKFDGNYLMEEGFSTVFNEPDPKEIKHPARTVKCSPCHLYVKEKDPKDKEKDKEERRKSKRSLKGWRLQFEDSEAGHVIDISPEKPTGKPPMPNEEKGSIKDPFFDKFYFMNVIYAGNRLRIKPYVRPFTNGPPPKEAMDLLFLEGFKDACKFLAKRKEWNQHELNYTREFKSFLETYLDSENYFLNTINPILLLFNQPDINQAVNKFNENSTVARFRDVVQRSEAKKNFESLITSFDEYTKARTKAEEIAAKKDSEQQEENN